MAFIITLPRLGFAMEEGTVTEWLVEDGGRVEAGAPLFLLESEKSVTEIEAAASGTLRIKVAAGEMHPVGTELGEIE
jgi:pyruvate/2-oxoglutarate dehydrogenase complex dihydrolipoamide acyltransferase (E2) component